jgi:hypothetical protein
MSRTRVATLAVAALAALGATAVSAAPAQANDVSLKYRNSAGEVIAKAWYDDLTDNLCVWTIASVGFARIGPVGSDLPHVEAADGDTRCTGNLSIPEDAYWRIRFDWRGSTKTDTFYT